MTFRKYTYRTPEGPRTTVQLSTEQLVDMMVGTKRGRAGFDLLGMGQHPPSQRHRRRKRLMVKMCLAMVEALMHEAIENNNRFVLPGGTSSIFAARVGRGLVRMSFRLDVERGSNNYRQFFRAGHSTRVTTCAKWYGRMQENAKKLKYRQP